MPRVPKVTDWPILAGMSEKARHAQTREVLTKACRYVVRRPRVATLSQVAAGIGVSVSELRDEAARWTDTDARLHRLITKLRCRMDDFMLHKDLGKVPVCVRRACAKIINAEIRERQIAADNHLVIEGSGFVVQIVNYARPGKKKKPAGNAKEDNGDGS